MSEYVDIAGLQVATPLYELVRDEITPGTGISDESVWQFFAAIIKDLTPKNETLLARRVELEKQINDWHLARKGQPHDADAYKQFLYEIGYLVKENDNFQITTQHVDPEIARIAGPQLVVPVNNARYALNAANAR